MHTNTLAHEHTHTRTYSHTRTHTRTLRLANPSGADFIFNIDWHIRGAYDVSAMALWRWYDAMAVIWRRLWRWSRHAVLTQLRGYVIPQVRPWWSYPLRSIDCHHAADVIHRYCICLPPPPPVIYVLHNYPGFYLVIFTQLFLEYSFRFNNILLPKFRLTFTSTLRHLSLYSTFNFVTCSTNFCHLGSYNAYRNGIMIAIFQIKIA